MAVGTRFNTVRLEKKLSRALSVASSGMVEAEYHAAAADVASTIRRRIEASGRGGDHNAEFAHQDVRVFRAASGRYNIMLGWLYPPASAHERGSGGKLWYQYQDSGFHLFGGPNWIEGVGATIDRREMLLERIEAINYQYVQTIARILD